MPMKNPPHPGDFIRTEIIEPTGLSVTAAAAALRVSPAVALRCRTREAKAWRMKMSSDLTPLMRQYRELKQRYPEALLFFRVGDFYEMFYEDAEIASRLLGLRPRLRYPVIQGNALRAPTRGFSGPRGRGTSIKPEGAGKVAIGVSGGPRCIRGCPACRSGG